MPKIDWDTYKGNEEKVFKKATPGTYTFIVTPDAEGTTFKGSTYTIRRNTPQQEEVAKFRFAATIVGGEFDGQKAFGEVNTMSRSWKDGSSSLQDFLASAKSSYRPGSTEEIVAEINAFPPRRYGIEVETGRLFTARTTWQWYCKECKHVFLEGYLKAKSPKNYEGPDVVIAKTGTKPNYEQVCPSCGGETRATLILSDYLTKAAVSSNGTKATTPTVTLPPAAG